MSAADLVERVRTACEAASETIAAIYLYGSVSRGEAAPDSDLDIGVVGRSGPLDPLSPPLEDLRNRLEAASRRNVDVVALETAPPDLVHRVLRDGILLLDRDRGRRIAFEVRSRNEYFDLEPVRRLYRAPRRQSP
jgi:predicted nucleotidyltransferase